MTIQRLGILGLAILAITAFETEPAAAQASCFWAGTSPICRGQCPRGYKTVAVSGKGCLNGYKVKCCEPVRSRSTG
jgi:hypothetical protein